MALCIFLLALYTYRASLASTCFALIVRRQLRPYLHSKYSEREEEEANVEGGPSPQFSVQPVPGGVGQIWHGDARVCCECSNPS